MVSDAKGGDVTKTLWKDNTVNGEKNIVIHNKTPKEMVSYLIQHKTKLMFRRERNKIRFKKGPILSDTL